MRVSSNKKILHLINGEFYSGAERVQDLLAQSLPLYGYDVWLACVKPVKFRECCKCDLSRVLDFPMKRQLDIGVALRLSRYVQDNQVSIIHSHTPRTALLGIIASRLSGVPLVHHLHSPTTRCTTQSFRNRINSSVEKFAARNAARVIPVSRSLVEYAEQIGLPAGKISVVCNGVSSPETLPERNEPGDIWVIGVAALFRERKGLEILLKAVARLLNAGVAVRLRAVGEFESQEYQRRIEKLVEQLGISKYIDWVGFVEDVDAEFQQMDIFVLPSLFGEGLPMVVLEAMANGVPVISTRVEGVPEVITDTTIGTLVEPENEVELAGAIQSLISSPDLWKLQRENAYKQQVDNFSTRSMAEGVARVYTDVLTSG